MSDLTYGLTSFTLTSINQIFKENIGVEEAILYGSRAKGNYKPGSDIDITLKGKSLTISDLNRIMNQFDDSFLPYQFDVSLFDHIDNDDLRDHIQRVGIVLYKK